MKTNEKVNEVPISCELDRNISDFDWNPKYGFERTPEAIMGGIKFFSKFVELKYNESKDVLEILAPMSICDSMNFDSICFLKNDPDYSPYKHNNSDKIIKLYIKRGNNLPIITPCENEPTCDSCCNCENGHPCRVCACGYYKFLTTYFPERLIKEREDYRKNKDYIDSFIIDRNQLNPISYSVQEIPYISTNKLDKIREDIDNFKYSSEQILDKDENEVYASFSYLVNDKVVTSSYKGLNIVNEYINHCINNNGLLSSKTEDILQYALVLKLLNQHMFKDYYNICLKKENGFKTIHGKSFYGFVAGNDDDEISEKINFLKENIKSQFNLKTSSCCECSLIELMYGIAKTQNTPNKYSIIEYLHLKDDCIHIVNGIKEFLSIYENVEKDGGDSYRQTNYLIKELQSYKDNRFIILTGTQSEIDEFLKINKNLNILFSENKVIIKDKTVEELYAIYFENLSDEVKKKMPKNAKKIFVEYLSFNAGMFSYTNNTLAKYLANYSNAHEEFKLPENLSDSRRKNFMQELDSLVGMENVKKSVKEFYDFSKFKEAAKENGLNLESSNMHMLFTGNPGTGKTTVARIIAKALFDIGVIKENKLIECERKDLVGEYVGQTAPKTTAIIEKAMGGVLFIDEAYSLTSSGSPNDYGGEAIATIIKAMEDHKNDLIVIFAGYKNEMSEFVSSNPGISSRIGYTFHFEDYTEDELFEMFKRKIKRSNMTISKGCYKKIKKILQYFGDVDNLGNGRFVDKFYQIVLQKKSASFNANDISQIKIQDIPDIQDIIDILPDNKYMITPEDVKIEDKRRVSYHELGHALISEEFKTENKIERITVESSGNGSLGYVKFKDEKRCGLKTKSAMRNEICCLMAGLAAEEVMLGEYSNGGGSDLPRATELAKHMIVDCGMSKTGFATRWISDDKDIINEINEILQEEFDRAKEIITEKKDIVIKLAEVLLKNGTINDEEIENFLKIAC